MTTRSITEGGSRLGSAIGNGLLAGLAGTLAMTISQMIEMKITKREPSTVPADGFSKALGVQPVSEESKQRLAQQVHWAYGTDWGVFRSLLSVANITGLPATTLHFVAVTGTALVMQPALEITPPVKEWGAGSVCKTLLHHAVYAIAAGLVFDALNKRK